MDGAPEPPKIQKSASKLLAKKINEGFRPIQALTQQNARARPASCLGKPTISQSLQRRSVSRISASQTQESIQSKGSKPKASMKKKNQLQLTLQPVRSRPSSCNPTPKFTPMQRLNVPSPANILKCTNRSVSNHSSVNSQFSMPLKKIVSKNALKTPDVKSKFFQSSSIKQHSTKRQILKQKDEQKLHLNQQVTSLKQ